MEQSKYAVSALNASAGEMISGPSGEPVLKSAISHQVNIISVMSLYISRIEAKMQALDERILEPSPDSGEKNQAPPSTLFTALSSNNREMDQLTIRLADIESHLNRLV